MRKSFLFFVLLMSFAAIAQAADQSQVLSIFNVPKLDRSVEISKEQYIELTKPVEETPLNNKDLAFRIRLPKDWQKLDVKIDVGENILSKRILGNIVEYLGPPTLDLRSSFRIRANDLPYDITAKDWFLSYVLTNNYALRGMDVSSEKRVQAQYVMVGDNGSQYGVRAVAEISGPRIILAEYIVPYEFWSKEKDVLKWVMAGFVLTNPDPSPIEVMQTYAFVDIAQFNYPSSWLLKSSPITSIERMGASLINLKGSDAAVRSDRSRNVDANVPLDGRIDISVVNKNPDVTLPKELGILKDQMLERKLVLGDLIEPVKGWPHHEGIISSKIEAYKVNNTRNKLAAYEQWVGIFETPGRYYFVTLLTVGRQDDFLIWARNVKAYQTVISTLSPVVR